MTPTSETPGTGPAGPVLTPQEWINLAHLLARNPDSTNASIRSKIGTYLKQRALHANDD